MKSIADRRPLVLVGDYILARKAEGANGPAWYQGRVHDVGYDTLNLFFSKKIGTAKSVRADIRFVYNRLPERRKHQAVTSPYKPTRLLFPDKAHINYSRVTPSEIKVRTQLRRLEVSTTTRKQAPGRGQTKEAHSQDQ